MVSFKQGGKFNQRIEIREYIETADSFGQPVPSISKTYTVWSDVRFLKAEERFTSAAVHSVRTAIFTVRYFEELDDNMLLYYQERLWKITGITEIGTKMWWDITAELMEN